MTRREMSQVQKGVIKPKICSLDYETTNCNEITGTVFKYRPNINLHPNLRDSQAILDLTK